MSSRLLGAFLSCVIAVAAPLGAWAQATEDELSSVDVAQDDGHLGNLSFRAAYNSERGPIVGADLEARRLFGRDVALRFSGEASEQDRRFSFSLVDPALLGGNPSFGVRLFANQSSASRTFGFDSSSVGIEPRLTWTLSDDVNLSTYLLISQERISDPRPGLSAFLAPDVGRRDRQAIGSALTYRFAAEGGARGAFEAGYEIGTTSRDTDYHKILLGLSMSQQFADGAVLVSARARAARLYMSKGASNVGDRFFLGSSSLRGFDFAGFGPRDLGAAGEPALGGEAYGILKLDVLFPTAIKGDAGGPLSGLVPGVFLDAGSLWKLSGPTFAGADSGSDLRASAGVTLKKAIGPGVLELSLAHAFERETYDRTQSVFVGFQASF